MSGGNNVFQVRVVRQIGLAYTIHIEHRAIFATERLVIRELQPEDLDFVAEMLGDPEVMQYWPRPLARPEAAQWIERHRRRYVEQGFGYWLAVRAKDHQPVGQLGLLSQEFDGHTEVGLGYMLHRPYWGQGYALEGARACLEYGFDDLGLQRVVVLIRPENQPSIRLVEKLGAERKGETNYAGYSHEVYAVQRPITR